MSQESGIKLIRGWKFDKYELGGNVNSTTHICVKKGDTRIEMTMNWCTHMRQIKADRNTPRGYTAIRFEVKKLEEALTQIDSLMRMLK